MKNELLDGIIKEYIVLPQEKEDLKSMIRCQIMKMFQRGQISAVEAASGTANIDQTVDGLYGQSESKISEDSLNNIIHNIKARSIERRDIVDHIVEISNVDILDLMIKSMAYDEIIKNNIIDQFTAAAIGEINKEAIANLANQTIITYRKSPAQDTFII